VVAVRGHDAGVVHDEDEEGILKGQLYSLVSLLPSCMIASFSDAATDRDEREVLPQIHRGASAPCWPATPTTWGGLQNRHCDGKRSRGGGDNQRKEFGGSESQWFSRRDSSSAAVDLVEVGRASHRL
jgi:hypothetical protein